MAIESQKNSGSTIQTYSSTSESNRSLRILFGNLSGFKARSRLVIA
ncbi:uncharacterized protein G2W53_007623 [Senna tora]|uniref:Uncharacterized protein n=1 Tax=Senna tora TaxID=362788 RepID=A0A835CDV0_9FABA|nr:uncharacterized protein G2W53_007623 [Senna tora]